MKKKCAVCGDTCQTNIIFKWQRDSDNQIFHICGLCAESGKVNAGSVHAETTSKYTTVDSTVCAETEDGKLRCRAIPKLRAGQYYATRSAFGTRK